MQNLLFTGASGFLGTNLKSVLEHNYNITTIGLSDKDNYNTNISKEIPQFKEKFDIVLHAAGKAHSVPKTEAEKQVFFDVNFQGTVNLCKGLEQSAIPSYIIFISTVAVYGVETGENISENHPLNGKTAYAQSKIQAERYLLEWCEKNNVTLSILRPSLIAGINPPGNLGAMINGIKTGKYVSIGGGKAHKSVLMVQDIACLIPSLLDNGGIYNVCDSEHPTFNQLELLISSQLQKKKPISIPFFIAKSMALVGDILGNRAPINSEKLDKITKSLTFSNEKAIRELNWTPLNVLVNFKIM